ncbi:MAG: Lacal_2735 family protein [Pseudomonadales bacterium]|nr:Lacal_2735 family protein [Pseudomonadales bacterium]MBO6701946.1 Lacal_2735 family protein [Pseudomonadales bacterium]MBO7007019.1 Lacal_2735 family protein [Pseudomonadales bacterium]
MFGLFKKDPTKKLQKRYEAKLEEAMHMQRNGKIREYSFLTAEAEEIRAQMEALKLESNAS